MRAIAGKNLSLFSNRNLPAIGIFMFVSCFVIFQNLRSLYYRHASVSEGAFHSDQVSKTELSLNNGLCPCAATDSSLMINKYYRSMCNQQADSRGSNQSVVSYSLFGDPEKDSIVLKRYFSSLESRAIRIAKVYPGWVMRIYHNLTKEQQENYLCSIKCNYTNVDLCDVNAIQSQELDSRLVRELNPRMWRFLVMLDPLVDRFLSRDIDSEIIPRETAAVRQWLTSNYTFHVMRDHPSHGGFMLAGLWGAKNHQRRSLMRRLGAALAYSSQDDDYETDQSRLGFVVWPFASFDVVCILFQTFDANKIHFYGFHVRREL